MYQVWFKKTGLEFNKKKDKQVSNLLSKKWNSIRLFAQQKQSEKLLSKSQLFFVDTAHFSFTFTFSENQWILCLQKVKL